MQQFTMVIRAFVVLFWPFPLRARGWTVSLITASAAGLVGLMNQISPKARRTGPNRGRGSAAFSDDDVLVVRRGTESGPYDRARSPLIRVSSARPEVSTSPTKVDGVHWIGTTRVGLLSSCSRMSFAALVAGDGPDASYPVIPT